MGSTLSIKSYCQFLLSTQTNYTLTYFADHVTELSHDRVTRMLGTRHLSPKHIWQESKKHIIESENAYLIFDDTVADKNHSFKIQGVKLQYSGNAHGLIKGIGIVNCVYVNPDTEEFWIIDYRIYDPEADGKTKIDHVKEMLHNLYFKRDLKFKTVLMDTWYSTHYLMLYIDSLGKTFYCPLKENRQVDDTLGKEKYKRVDQLAWTDEEKVKGKTIKVKKFPRDFRVKLFRVEAKHQTEFIVTNNLSEDSCDHVGETCKIRWNVEEFHRELKQTTGLEACECRKRRSQRNHIACAMLVWLRLKAIAKEVGKTIYQLKQGLLDDYLMAELENPRLQMAVA